MKSTLAQYTLRTGAAAFGAAAAQYFAPALPHVLLCTAMTGLDTVSAIALSRRLRRHDKNAPPHVGRISSHRLGKSCATLARIYAMLLVAVAVDTHILRGDGYAMRCASGAIVFWQAVSVLENEATCSDNRWARIARRFLIDKAGRHFADRL